MESWKEKVCVGVCAALASCDAHKSRSCAVCSKLDGQSAILVERVTAHSQLACPQEARHRRAGSHAGASLSCRPHLRLAGSATSMRLGYGRFSPPMSATKSSLLFVSRGFSVFSSPTVLIVYPL